MMGVSAAQLAGGTGMDAGQKKRLLWGGKKAEAAVASAAAPAVASAPAPGQVGGSRDRGRLSGCGHGC